MAKSLLLNILVDILGNYVEDLGKDNLKLAVWSGTIELFNLKLKSTALDKLNLPVKVLRGSLKKLQLKIPWTNLESKPVSVIMDGMFLETGPVDLSEISAKDAKRMVSKSRQKKMEKAERAIMAIIHNKSYKRKKKASYMKQLTAKIMDNLEISITNLHIRYEDQDSIPGSIISCGLTIESISLQTTDDQWNPAYINREGDKNAAEGDAAEAAKKKKLSAIHKLGVLTNLAIYWNSAHSNNYDKQLLKKARNALTLGAMSMPSSPHGPMSPTPATPAPTQATSATSTLGALGGGLLGFDSGPVVQTEDEQARIRWEAKMQSLIYTDATEASDSSAAAAGISIDDDPERETLENMKYLLRPPNKITIKTVHRELCTETMPNMDLTITCSTLQSKLCDDQYRQLRTLSKVLKGLDRRKLMLYHRPGKRPSQDAKAWWHYAYFLATGNYPIRRAKMEVMADCIKAKKHLVPFWRRNLVNKEVIADQEFMLPADFCESELSAEVKAWDLEDALPISALIALRQYAAQEAVIEIKHLRASPQDMKKYVEVHHLDPQREEDAKNKFWGLGKMKLGKKEVDEGDFLPGKKKKGLLKLLFKRTKKHKEEPMGEQSTSSATAAVAGGAGKLALVNPQGIPGTAKADGNEGDGTDGDSDGDLTADNRDSQHDLMDADIDLAFADKDEKEPENEGEGDNNDHEADEDAKLMEELQSALIKSSLDADQAFTSRIKIATSLSLKVNLAAQTIVVVSMAVRFCVEKRRNLQRFILEIDNLSVRDTVSVKPIFKNLVSADKSLLNSKVLKRASIMQTNGAVVIPSIEFTKTDKMETYSEGTAQFNLLFEKKKGDSVEKGNSSLFIKTSPMQIVWNELCIRQLLLCFASKSTASDIDVFMQTAVERNKLLSQGIKKFKAELSAPSYKVTTINMEIFSPSILIPEQFDEDQGCMRIDVGKLLIHGRKGYAGMSLKVNLMSVNIGIPTRIVQPRPGSVGDGRASGGEGRARSGTTGDGRGRANTSGGDGVDYDRAALDAAASLDSSYLIKPFDINITVDKFTHNKVADLILDISIAPRIDAHLDALKLIRLKYILDIVAKTLKKRKDPLAGGAAGAKAKKKKKKKLEPEDEAEIDFSRQKTVFRFSLPSAVINLALSPDHTVDFSVHSIGVSFVERAGDVRVVIGLDSLSLNDSMRPRNHQAIIWTTDSHDAHHHHHHHHPHTHGHVSTIRGLFGAVESDSSDEETEKAKDPSQHAIVFAYTNISTVMSPLFEGIQQDISISWGNICSNIDDRSVLRFGPFMSDLTNTVKTYKAKAEDHAKFVEAFMLSMSLAAAEYNSAHKVSRFQAPPEMMSPGGTAVHPNITVGRGASRVPSEASSAANSNRNSARLSLTNPGTPVRPTMPAPLSAEKSSKIGHSRVTFRAKALSIDILQELALAGPATVTTIDSSRAFSPERNSIAHDSYRDFSVLEDEAHQHNFSVVGGAVGGAIGGALGGAIGGAIGGTMFDVAGGQSTHSDDHRASLGSADIDLDGLAENVDGSDGGSEEGDAEEEEEEEDGFETAFRIEFDDLFFQMVSKQDEKEINAHVTSFCLKDVRQSSQKFVFNTLLSRSDKQRALQSEEASAKQKTHQQREKSEHILHLHLIKQTKFFIDIEVVLEDITSYISVDIFLAFANLAKENVKAYQTVKKIIKSNKKKAEPTLKTKLAMEAYAKSKRKGSTAEAPPISEKKVQRNLSITVLNPRLFLLENPEDIATKAIVSDCKIDFFIVRETYTYQFVDHDRVEVKDSIHLSLREFQLFVWTNIQEQSMPHQIIEPAGMDIHLISATENDVSLLKQFKCSTDNLRGRVSLNDIVLTSSILARAKLTKKKAKKSGPKKDKKKKKSKRRVSQAEQQAQALMSENSAVFLTMYKVDLNIGSISVVLLNDFNNQNVPMFKMCLDESDFNAEGSLQHMEGEGTIMFSADNYNVKATCWEPIIEPFRPTLVFSKDFNGTRFTIKSDANLQLNITGIMCSCYYRSKSLVAKIGKTGAYGTQRTIFPLIVRNLLGVPVELYDSRTQESILKLLDAQVRAVPSKNVTNVLPGGGNNSEQLRSETFADLFDIHLLGPEAAQRVPILQAPLTAGRPKRYLFRHVQRQAHHCEPILEEVFENERYNPLRRAWVDPWMQYIDPPKWTDSRLNEVPDPACFVLPLQWRWIDEWTPDVGEIGLETDADGWEYESNFIQFSACRYDRRAKQPLDVVRRRRLVRTRVPCAPDGPSLVSTPVSMSGDQQDSATVTPRRRSASVTSMNLGGRRRSQSIQPAVEEAPPPPPMPMAVFWEVVTKGDESREIIISSGLHVRNEGPCPIEIELLSEALEPSSIGGSGNNSPKHSGATAASNNILRVEEGGTVGVPIFLATHEFIRIRPAGTRRAEYDWSERIHSHVRADRFSEAIVKHVYCARLHDDKEESNIGGFHYAVQLVLKDKQVVITCSVNATLFNGLPCPLTLFCTNNPDVSTLLRSGGGAGISNDNSAENSGDAFASQATANAVESEKSRLYLTDANFLQPGTSCKVPRLDMSKDVYLVLEVGEFASVAPMKVVDFANFASSEQIVWLRDKVSGAPHTASLRSNRSAAALSSIDENSSRDGTSTKTSELQSQCDDLDATQHSYAPGSLDDAQFSVTVRTELTPSGVLSVVVYSQFLLVDQSDSQVVVRSNFTEQSATATKRIPLPRRKLKRRPSGMGGTSKAERYASSSFTDSAATAATPSKSKSKKGEPEVVFKSVDRRAFSNQPQFTGKTVAEQVLTLARSDVSECWSAGVAGITMFQAGGEQKISLGVNRGAGWCVDIPLDSLSSTKFPIEVVDEHTKDCRNVALMMTPLSNNLVSTSILRIIPCYTFVNCMDVTIEILHPSDEFFDNEDGNFSIPGKSSRPWHRPALHKDTVVRLRCENSGASVGTVDINELGTTILVLPRFKDDDNFRGEDLIIAHVEVKFSEPSYPSYITVAIWRSLLKFDVDMEIQQSQSSAYLSVRNETDFPFTIQQDGAIAMFDSTSDPERLHKFDLNIMPGQWLPYGWTDPKLGKSVLASLGAVVHGSQTGLQAAGNRQSVNRRQSTSSFGVNPSCVVDTRKVNKITVMDLSTLHGDSAVNISFAMKTLGNGLVLCIYKSNELLGTGAKMYFKGPDTDNPDAAAVNVMAKEVDEQRKHLVFKMQIRGISMSLIAELPQRRELLGLFIDQFQTTLRKAPESAKEGAMSSIEVKIRDLQVDNYSESTVFPVLATSSYSEERSAITRHLRMNADANQSGRSTPSTHILRADTPPDLQPHAQQQSMLQQQKRPQEEYPCFLQFTAAKEAPKGRGKVDAIIKYVGLRILELKIAVDSSSIVMFYLDLQRGMVSNVSNSIDNSDPVAVKMYYDDFNLATANALLKHSGLNALDHEKVFKKAQVKKYFFETVIIHPLKFTLTFTPTSLPRFESDPVFRANKKLRLLQAGQGLPEIENFDIKLSSFQVQQAMETIKSMKLRVVKKVKGELKSNLVLIGGKLLSSMNIVGKPAGLMKNVGNGVQAFFYEPYLGSMDGASGFAVGLGKGTQALVSGVASGIVGYTASVVGTATSGVSLLARGVVAMSSGEDEDKFLQNRETNRRLFKASSGATGIANGFKQGGMDFFSGLTSGVKGLVSKPMQEGKKSGALGVMRGMGMGIVGAVVKPVLGVSDGVTTVAAGFTKQLLADSTYLVKHARPPRALERANPVSGKVLVLLPMDLFAAKAQHFLKQCTHEKDEYLASCTLGYQISAEEYPTAEYGLLLSTTHIYLLTASVQKVWEVSFSELSHIVLKKNLNPNAVGTDQTQYGVVGFVLYGCSLAVTKTVNCPSRLHAIRLYAFLLKFAYRMGNPQAIVPVDELIAEASATGGSTGSKDMALGLNLETYVFGYANNLRLPLSLSDSFTTETQIIDTAREKLKYAFCQDMSDKDNLYFFHRQMDETMFVLAMAWKHHHTMKLSPSHCCVCLLLNNAPSYAPVQLLDLELIEGRDYVVLSVNSSYDPISRTIAPCGGACVIFAYGFPPTLREAPSVKLHIRTTAFTTTISSQKGEPNCINHNGFIVGYLEKAQADFWSKAVINITLQK